MYGTDMPKTGNDGGNGGGDNEKVVMNCSDNKQITTVVFSQNDFNTLSLGEQANYVRKLYHDSNFDAVKELVQNNERLRIAFHEAGHVAVAKIVGKGKIKFNEVSLGVGSDNLQTSQQKVGVSHGRVVRSNFLQFDNDYQYIQIQLAGYIMERGMGIDNDSAYNHAGQDFHDLYTWQLFDYMYEEGYEPAGFNEEGTLGYREVNPPLTKEQIQQKFSTLFGQIMPEVALLLKDSRSLYYTIACALYEKGILSYDDVEGLPSL